VHIVSKEAAKTDLHPQVPVVQLPVPNGAGYFLNAPFLRATLKRLKPSLLHVHYASGYGTLGSLAGYHPFLLSVWGSDVYEFPRRSLLHKQLFMRALRHPDRISSTSRDMAREVSRYTDRPISVCPFGVDTKLFAPRPTAPLFATEDLVIGTVKTLEPVYGIDILLKAFAKVTTWHRELPLKLLIVGSGSEKSTLVNLAQTLGILSHVRFVDAVPHRRVSDYLNMLTIGVMPSRRESFGVAALEAGACEVPVVVSRVGGLPEVVEDGATGLVVTEESVDETASAIDRLIRDPALRRRMGRAARTRVEKLYSWSASLDAMELLYDKMRSSRSA